MRRHPLPIFLTVLATILVASTFWLVIGLRPLGALSVSGLLPGVIRTEASPCILMVSADGGTADRVAVVAALQLYAAENGFKLTGDSTQPIQTVYGTATYDGPGTLSLLASVDPRRIAIQLFRDERDYTDYNQQVSQAVSAFQAAKLNRTECR